MTRPFADMLHRAGTYEEWQKVFAIYGEAGMEGHAFGAMTGFGAPLFKFSGQNGAVINLYHQDSGTGKTTTLMLANSIYGHPKSLLSTPDDTYNARIAKLGIYNNLCFTADEMTNTPAEDLSRLLYSMSQGRGKDRMSQSNNQLRENSTTWQTISLCSANNSFAAKMQAIKDNPDGELMRLLEFDLGKEDMRIIPEHKRLIDETLLNNYGWAGPKYISFILRNKPQAIHLLKETQDDLIKKLNAKQHERFWVSAVASNLTGGIIAGEKLGMLIGWNLSRIREWALDHFIGMRKDRALSVKTPEDTLGEFLIQYIGTLLVDSGNAALGKPLIPLVNANMKVVLRYEEKTKKLFAVRKYFLAYCHENSIDPKSTLEALAKREILTNSIDRKRMTTGCGFPTPGVPALEFDYTHPIISGIVPIPNAAKP
jgi:hypothetical protein